VEVILEVRQDEIEEQMDIAPAIFMETVLTIIKKHFEETIDKVIIKRSWREIGLTLVEKDGQDVDALRALGQVALDEILESFGLEGIEGWTRTWNTGSHIEIFIRYQRG